MSDRLLTSAEVAEWLGVGVKLVQRRAREGELPAIWTGSEWRFRRGSIDGWLDEQERSRRRGAPSEPWREAPPTGRRGARAE
jgi:excisionase family DNA binding protein